VDLLFCMYLVLYFQSLAQFLQDLPSWEIQSSEITQFYFYLKIKQHNTLSAAFQFNFYLKIKTMHYLVCSILMQHQRKHLLLKSTISRSPIFTPINEDVVFAWMGMQVTVHLSSTVFHQPVTKSMLGHGHCMYHINWL
jgi:hypothetical protein